MALEVFRIGDHHRPTCSLIGVAGSTAPRVARDLVAAASARIAGRRRKWRRPAAGIIGLVDGLIDGDLRGWIVNVDAPARAETIWCVGRSGQTLALKPTCRRDDASRACNIEDVRGFAVPVDLLRELGPVISVRNERGEVLGGGSNIALPASARPALGRSADPQWLFMHIPKTAGSSLRNALLETLPAGDVLFVYPGRDLGVTYEECVDLPQPQLARFRWICGHYKTGLHRYIAAPARYVTFIREPLARLRSNVAHHAVAGTRFEVDGTVVRPSDFINGGLGEEFDNLMTRMISGAPPGEDAPGVIGEAHVDLAIENIRRYFAFVGRQEHLASDARVLQRRAGLDLVTPGFVNVTPARRRYGSEEMAAIDWPLVARRNRFDMLLHERILAMDLASRVLS